VDELRRYREAVDGYWPAVDAFFDELPGDLYRQGKLLRENLASQRSATGEFHDILRRTDDHPLLHYHLWLLDDLDVTHDDRRAALEQQLFAAMVSSFALHALLADMHSLDSFIDARFAGLADALRRDEIQRFASLIGIGSSVWETHQSVWNGSAAAAESATEDRQAPFVLSGLAVFETCGRGNDRESLLATLGHLNAVLATKRDLLSIRPDLYRGLITAPIRLMLDASGLSSDAVGDPDRALGAMLLERSIAAVEPSWRSNLEGLTDGAARLGLPTLGRYGSFLETVMADIGASLDLGAGDRVITTPPRFEPVSDPMRDAIAMAERFLLADPSFEEAWEVHRWGMAGASEVTARFPSGLVIEVLGKRGHDVADLVDDFFRQAAERRFAYYDHPDLPYVETDTLGTMLRLYAYSKQTDWHRDLLDEFIAPLEKYVGSDGRLPVWLVDRPTNDLLLGEGCGTIAVNLVRGLLEYDTERFASLAEPAAGLLVEDFTTRGASITVNYPRSYLLAAMAELLVRLERSGLMAGDMAWEQLARQIETETIRDRLTPQHAACLTLACGHSSTAALLEESWMSAILKGQSFDGGWEGEPLFFAPNRGGTTTWHRSRLLTSALCYDALATTGAA
jgi:hypothetical protein